MDGSDSTSHHTQSTVKKVQKQNEWDNSVSNGLEIILRFETDINSLNTILKISSRIYDKSKILDTSETPSTEDSTTKKNHGIIHKSGSNSNSPTDGGASLHSTKNKWYNNNQPLNWLLNHYNNIIN